MATRQVPGFPVGGQRTARPLDQPFDLGQVAEDEGEHDGHLQGLGGPDRLPIVLDPAGVAERDSREAPRVQRPGSQPGCQLPEGQGLAGRGQRLLGAAGQRVVHPARGVRLGERVAGRHLLQQPDRALQQPSGLGGAAPFCGHHGEPGRRLAGAATSCRVW